MKLWRPNGWKNPYWLPPSTEDDIGREFRYKREGVSKGETYEAGADAMLEALLKMGEYEHGNCDETCSQRGVITIRFIPEENDEKTS